MDTMFLQADMNCNNFYLSVSQFLDVRDAWGTCDRGEKSQSSTFSLRRNFFPTAKECIINTLSEAPEEEDAILAHTVKILTD